MALLRDFNIYLSTLESDIRKINSFCWQLMQNENAIERLPEIIAITERYLYDKNEG